MTAARLLPRYSLHVWPRELHANGSLRLPPGQITSLCDNKLDTKKALADLAFNLACSGFFVF